MSLCPFDSFQSRFVTYLLNFPRISFTWQQLLGESAATRPTYCVYVVTTQFHCVYCARRTACFNITEGRLTGRQETKKIQVKLATTCYKKAQQQDAKNNADL